jgi:hypothetical protein
MLRPKVFFSWRVSQLRAWKQPICEAHFRTTWFSRLLAKSTGVPSHAVSFELWPGRRLPTSRRKECRKNPAMEGFDQAGWGSRHQSIEGKQNAVQA